jgi:hypothetical protein
MLRSVLAARVHALRASVVADSPESRGMERKAANSTVEESQVRFANLGHPGFDVRQSFESKQRGEVLEHGALQF